MDGTTEQAIPLVEYGRAVWRRRSLMAVLLVVAIVAAIIYSKLATPLYESTAAVLPPLAGEFGGAGLSGPKLLGGNISSLLGGTSPATQVVIAMLKSRRMANDVIDRFQLTEKYKKRYRDDAIKKLSDRTRIVVSDENVIIVAVADEDRNLAAEMANFYVENLETINADPDVQVTAAKPFVRKLDKAQPAERPFRPNLPLNVAISIVLALGVGFLLSLLLEQRQKLRARRNGGAISTAGTAACALFSLALWGAGCSATAAPAPPQKQDIAPADIVKAETAQQEAVPTEKTDFWVGFSVVPSVWIKNRDWDLDKIKEIGNTLFVHAGSSQRYQKQHLAPLLDSAAARGLRVVLCYYAITAGDTTLEGLVREYGAHPSVVAFKVKDELGENSDAASCLEFLRERHKIIRAHSTKPILVDTIPWEFWKPGVASYEQRAAGMKNAAIDSYARSRYVDGILISVDDRYANVADVLSQCVNRWGGSVKIYCRSRGSFQGEGFSRSGMTVQRAKELAERQLEARRAGASGIHYYAWRHANYRILNDDGSTNPLFDSFVEAFKLLRKTDGTAP